TENAEKRSDAEKAASGVEGNPVQLIRQASNVGHLYGSVSARDIVEALEGVGAKLSKSQIVLDRPIKAIGMHDVKVSLHPEVSVTIHVNVARSPEEADLQAQGVDVLAQMFEEEAAPLVAEELAAEAQADERVAEAAATEAPAAEEAHSEETPAEEAAAPAEPETTEDEQ